MANVSFASQSSPINPQTIHIVYVHGFRGDHTTFQAFPSDLHGRLLPDIPGLQTWVYPTYKSAKPLSFAVSNFLTWLGSLPEGPVILAGHSMGGLLVAEAATSNRPVSKRIVGILAFDTPYLGMHPHVVVSGIASLFGKKDEGKPKTAEEKNNPGPPAPSAEGLPSEQALNDGDAVNFVNAHDAFPGTGHLSPSARPQLQHSKSGSGTLSPSSAQSPSGSIAGSGTSGGSSFLDNAKSFFAKHADDPFVRFINKHSDAPVSAMSRWVMEYFEFGFAMFDYPNLLERYEKLEKWEGDWVNYWTVTPPEFGSVTSDPEDGGRSSDPDRPPTPRKARKMKRAASPGEVFENEFEKAMKSAREKEERRKNKELDRQLKKEEKARLDRERAAEKARKKEEEAQEKERKRAIEAMEKERKAKEEAERKEQQRLAKEEARREKEAAKLAKQQEGKEKEKEKQVSEDESAVEDKATVAKVKEPTEQESASPEPNIPELVIEQDDSSQAADVDSNASSFRTALETHNGGSQAPSPPQSAKSISQPPSPGRSSTHHFISLPGTLHPKCRRHWLKVRIAGVQDEVSAHCGLFIREQNLGYDVFVDRVGNLVKSWVL